MSFLEMLDVVNERLTERGEEPIAFDHDCREGICGTCGLMINGVAHGPLKGTATCQLHMRSFKDGDTIYVEPWRPRAFPVIKDLVVDRGALDRIIQAGGFITAATGGAPDANNDPDPQGERRRRDGCRGVHRLRRVRRGVPERVGVAVHRGEDLAPRAAAAGPAGAISPRAGRWSRRWISRASAAARCHGECQEACPKEISIDTITRMNRDFIRAGVLGTRP